MQVHFKSDYLRLLFCDKYFKGDLSVKANQSYRHVVQYILSAHNLNDLYAAAFLNLSSQPPYSIKIDSKTPITLGYNRKANSFNRHHRNHIMNQLLPAEPIHAGAILKSELIARGWTQHDLADIINRPPKTINQIITGKMGITPDTAMQLSYALGISAETWLNLQSRYQLSLLEMESEKYADIPRRAALYQNYPIKDMLKRGWIHTGQTLDDLENAIKAFFNIDDIQQPHIFPFSAKQNANAYNTQQISTVNLAWLNKVKQLANSQITTGKFSIQAAQKAIEKLSTLLLSPEEIRHVPRILSESGIRFVLVESLPNSKLDAACFWLDDQSPVIGLTLRYDRIDNFWFTLRHELEHVIQGDSKNTPILDEDVGLGNNELPLEEQRANRAAADFCVPTKKLDSYILRAGAYIFAEQKIKAFAGINKIHIGLVVGQLHHRTGKYQQLRKYLVPIRQFILNSSTYDGWGLNYGD